MLLHMTTFSWGPWLPLHKHLKHVKARAVLPASPEPSHLLSEYVRIKYHMRPTLKFFTFKPGKNGKRLYGHPHLSG